MNVSKAQTTKVLCREVNLDILWLACLFSHATLKSLTHHCLWLPRASTVFVYLLECQMTREHYVMCWHHSRRRMNKDNYTVAHGCLSLQSSLARNWWAGASHEFPKACPLRRYHCSTLRYLMSLCRKHSSKCFLYLGEPGSLWDSGVPLFRIVWMQKR